jgi:multidrug resistance efflux pump
VGLLALGGWNVVPGLIHPISTDAVVNAEVITVRAPTDGLLAEPGPAIGEKVEARQVLGRVRAATPERGRLDGLRLELSAQKNLAEALDREVSELGALDKRLGREADDYRSATSDRLRLEEVAAAARVKGAEAALGKARAELERKRALFAKDLVAPVAVATAEAEERSAGADLDAASAELGQVRSGRAALKRGTVADNGSGAPYAAQRRDELRVKRLERSSERAAVRARVAELTRQLDDEETRVARLNRAELNSPATGVVWQRFATEGDGLRAGDPVFGVVDCKTLFLTAVLPKRYFTEVGAGDRARVHLLGQSEPITAVVQSVRAAGAGQANTSAAVTPVAEEGRDVVVTLAVGTGELGGRPDNLCQVGQRASVTFALPALKPLVDAVASVVGGHGPAS